MGLLSRKRKSPSLKLKPRSRTRSASCKLLTRSSWRRRTTPLLLSKKVAWAWPKLFLLATTRRSNSYLFLAVSTLFVGIPKFYQKKKKKKKSCHLIRMTFYILTSDADKFNTVEFGGTEVTSQRFSFPRGDSLSLLRLLSVIILSSFACLT